MINEEALEKAMSEIWEIEGRFITDSGAAIQKAIKDVLEEEGIFIEKESHFVDYIRSNIKAITKQKPNGDMTTTFFHNEVPILESFLEVVDFPEMRHKFTIKRIK